MNHSKFDHNFPSPIDPCACGITTQKLETKILSLYQTYLGHLPEIVREEQKRLAHLECSRRGVHYFQGDVCYECGWPKGQAFTSSAIKSEYPNAKPIDFNVPKESPFKFRAPSPAFKKALGEIKEAFEKAPHLTDAMRYNQLYAKNKIDCVACNKTFEIALNARAPLLTISYPSGEQETWCDPCAKDLLVDINYRRKESKRKGSNKR
jgi:hypothetical protein